MEDSEIFVGLDIGTTKIVTVVGHANEDGKVEVLGYGKTESTGVQHGLIRNIIKTVDGIKKSLEIAQEHSNEQIESIYAGIAGRHIKSSEYKHEIKRFNGKETIIQQEEIDKMLQDMEGILLPAGEKIITIIPQRFVIDNERETNEPVGEMGELVIGYFQIITGDENEIKKIVRCVNEAEINVEDIILEPIASGLACLSDEEKKRGVLLIDIGGGTTDIAIYYQGNPVFSEVIPFGGNVITKDIASICQITDDLAETIKIKYGTCIEEKSNRNNIITIPQFYGNESKQISEQYLAKIIYTRFQESIIRPIKTIIEHSGYKDKLQGGIVLTGGGSTLRHIKELIQYELSKPTRIGKPDIGFSHSLSNNLRHPMYVTVLGLLKYAILKTEKEREQAPVSKPKKKNNKGKKSTTNSENGIFKKIETFFTNLLESTP